MVLSFVYTRAFDTEEADRRSVRYLHVWGIRPVINPQPCMGHFTGFNKGQIPTLAPMGGGGGGGGGGYPCYNDRRIIFDCRRLT